MNEKVQHSLGFFFSPCVLVCVPAGCTDAWSANSIIVFHALAFLIDNFCDVWRFVVRAP